MMEPGGEGKSRGNSGAPGSLVTTTIAEIAELMDAGLKRKETIRLGDITGGTINDIEVTENGVGANKGVKSASPSPDDGTWMVSKRMKSADSQTPSLGASPPAVLSVSTKLSRLASNEDGNMFSEFICDDAKRDQEDDWMEGVSVARSRGAQSMAIGIPGQLNNPSALQPGHTENLNKFGSIVSIATEDKGRFTMSNIPSKTDTDVQYLNKSQSSSVSSATTLTPNAMIPPPDFLGSVATYPPGRLGHDSSTLAPVQAQPQSLHLSGHRQPESLLDMYRSQASKHRPDSFFPGHSSSSPNSHFPTHSYAPSPPAFSGFSNRPNGPDMASPTAGTGV
jgi:hypothetical protein